MNRKKLKYGIYLIFYPILGAGVGCFCYWVYILLGNKPSDVIFNLFFYTWLCFGGAAGLHAGYLIWKMNKNIRLFIKNKR